MKPDTENIYQRKINQVIDYINANLHLPLRLDIIAGQVNVSERQLLRIMKGALNESLYAYVARQRVERAVLYRHTEDMSLADLASRVGYDNPQSFSKAFKKQFSVSPKAYMDKLRVRLREETEKWSNASVGKEIIPSGMFGTIRLQKGKYAVYTLKGSYAGLQELYNLKSATKLFSVLLASKRPLITELADKLRLIYPLLPTISPCPTMRLEAIRSIIPISCRRYPKSV